MTPDVVSPFDTIRLIRDQLIQTRQAPPTLVEVMQTITQSSDHAIDAFTFMGTVMARVPLIAEIVLEMYIRTLKVIRLAEEVPDEKIDRPATQRYMVPPPKLRM